MALALAQLCLYLGAKRLHRCLIHLLRELLALQGLELLSALNKSNPVVIVIILQIAEAGHHEVVALDGFLKIWQAILVSKLLACSHGAEIEGIVFFDGVEMQELARELKVNDATTTNHLLGLTSLIAEKAVTIQHEARRHRLVHRHANRRPEVLWWHLELPLVELLRRELKPKCYIDLRLQLVE